MSLTHHMYETNQMNEKQKNVSFEIGPGIGDITFISYGTHHWNASRDLKSSGKGSLKYKGSIPSDLRVTSHQLPKLHIIRHARSYSKFCTEYFKLKDLNHLNKYLFFIDLTNLQYFLS